jgi:putative drug exporter of the RND superfamily
MIASAEDASDDGVQVELSGLAISNAELEQGGSEGLGIMVALVILLISFGSVVAAGLPIPTAVMGIGLAILEFLANVVNVGNFSPIVAAMVGIGVGIDYALFIVTRYRVMLGGPERATVGAIGTAGRAVLFAGTTVVISVMGILVMGLPLRGRVGLGLRRRRRGGMLASITLLAAMLGFAGSSIDRLRIPFLSHQQTNHRAGFWFRWSRLMQRRPWPAFAIGALIIVALTLPALDLRLRFPATSPSRPPRRAGGPSTSSRKGSGPGSALL